jgi:glyoxalase family protein
MSRQILGIHHITAIAGDAERNIDFYTGVLGLRLVKITVNFDDPGSYHLYYGDGHGHPGTILTFFAWPGAHRGRPGNSQVTASSLAIPAGSAQFWMDRFAAKAVDFEATEQRFAQTVIPFTDPDGLHLELVETGDIDSSHRWNDGGVTADAAIAGFHSATLSETGYERTAKLLTETMGFRLTSQDRNRFRYETDSGGASKTVDLICAPGGTEGRVAAGTVHHIAWRTPDEAQQLAWLTELSRLDYNVTPVIDRVYFHSIYYREPGGILFEIATDPPGFTVDEPFEKLGTALQLPPWLEPYRNRIEAALPPIRRLQHGAAQ